MLNRLTSIRLNADYYNNYYIGQIVKQTPQWTTFQSIDEANNIGGINILNNSEISFPQNANDLAFYKLLEKAGKIKDPFNQQEKNKEVISWKWTNLTDLFKIIQDQKLIVDLETRDDYLSGRIQEVSDDNIQIAPLDSEFLLADQISKIELQDIISISINVTMSNFLTSWQKDYQFQTESQLKEFYFSYEEKERQDDFLLGKVIAETQDSYLVEAITDWGTLDSYTLVNKNWLSHCRQNKFLFYDYLVKQNKKIGAYNQNNLKIAIPEQLAVKSVIQSSPVNSIITVNNIAYTGQNIGILKTKSDYGFTMQNFDNYKLVGIDRFDYRSIASMDLVSNDQYYYQVLL